MYAEHESGVLLRVGGGEGVSSTGLEVSRTVLSAKIFFQALITRWGFFPSLLAFSPLLVLWFIVLHRLFSVLPFFVAVFFFCRGMSSERRRSSMRRPSSGPWWQRQRTHRCV